MKPETKPPREVYVEFFGDPSDDRECYKRYSARTPFKPVGLDAEVIHYIEKAVYDEALAKIELLEKELAVYKGPRLTSAGAQIKYLCEENAKLKAANERMKAALKSALKTFNNTVASYENHGLESGHNAIDYSTAKNFVTEFEALASLGKGE